VAISRTPRCSATAAGSPGARSARAPGLPDPAPDTRSADQPMEIRVALIRHAHPTMLAVPTCTSSRQRNGAIRGRPMLTASWLLGSCVRMYTRVPDLDPPPTRPPSARWGLLPLLPQALRPAQPNTTLTGTLRRPSGTPPSLQCSPRPPSARPEPGICFDSRIPGHPQAAGSNPTSRLHSHAGPTVSRTVGERQCGGPVRGPGGGTPLSRRWRSGAPGGLPIPRTVAGLCPRQGTAPAQA
jgi:hypothetical protein